MGSIPLSKSPRANRVSVWLYESPTLTWHHQQLLFGECSSTELTLIRILVLLSLLTDRWLLMSSRGPPGAHCGKEARLLRAGIPAGNGCSDVSGSPASTSPASRGPGLPLGAVGGSQLRDGAASRSPCASTSLLPCVILCLCSSPAAQLTLSLGKFLLRASTGNLGISLVETGVYPQLERVINCNIPLWEWIQP